MATLGPYTYVSKDGKTDAELYLTDVSDGRIIACDDMRRLAEVMLPRFHEPYRQWHYDVEKATRPVRWIEKFACYPEGEKMGKPFILEDYERMAIELGFGFVDDDDVRQYKQILMELARKCGKALSLDTEIPTPDGWRLMGDIHVGDVVFGQDGKPSTVIAESEIFDKPMYLVTFEDGATVKASGDHVWTVQTRSSRRCARNYLPGKTSQTNRRKYREGGWFETTTQEMFDDEHFLRRRKDGKGIDYKYRVPMCLPVEYPEKDLPIDPYVLGYWLGDGTSTKPQVTIGRQDEEEAVELLANHGHTVTRHYYESDGDYRAHTYSIDHRDRGCGRNPFTLRLEELGLIGNKHIPDMYMLASINQRWELLRGLMDTDGCCGKNGECEFTQKRKVLAEQVVELCASLGIKASMYDKQATCNGRPAGTVYRVFFHTDADHSCFHIGRKHARLKKQLSPRMLCKTIVKIERIPNEPSKCIAIDNDSHLYLAGRQYTATHNTSLLAAIMLYMLCGDGEKGAEVYCCANSESQARKCFGAADAMRQHSPSLNKRLRRGRVQKRGVSGVNYDKTGSFLVPLAANVGKLDGLSASAIVYDELAAATDNGALLDILTESTSARRSPMTWIISTENYQRFNIWDERIAYAQGWLKGDIEDDTFLPILYHLDSYDEVFQEEMWPKASPGLLCGIKSWQYLRDRVNTARQSPARMPSLLTKEFNLRANSASTFFTKEECLSNTEPFELNPKTDRYCCVGFDLSSRGDLTSAVAVFMRPGDDHIYEITRSWIPEEQVRINAAKDFKERDGVPYHLWATKESCGMPIFEIVEGDKIDQRVILEFIRELAGKGLYAKYVGFDGWHVEDSTLRELKMMVGEKNAEAVPQQAKVLSPAMKELQLDLRAKRVCCNNAEPLVWARGNLQTKPPDANDNLFPQKRDLKPHNKIDPVMAELFAMIALRKHMDDYMAAINA